MTGPAGLSVRNPGLVAVLLVAGCASMLSEADQEILDFSRPPTNLYPESLVRHNGEVVSSSDACSGLRVEAGKHEIAVAAFIGGPLNVGRDQPATTQADPGLATIDVKTGTRCRIAARLIVKRGEWEPVVWSIEDVR